MTKATALMTTIALAAVVSSVPARAQQPDAYDRAVTAVQERMSLVDQQEDRIPGRVLVFARAGAEPVVDARGVAHVEKGTPADGDTPFYIASMTKAFVGLMALRLDRMGIMPLDMTLAEAYPEMRVEGVDLAKVTMRHALSHRLGFYSPPLSMRTAYTDRVPVSDYAQLVNAAQEATDANFSYSNNGPILYAGALEQSTGRSWKAWLDELVLHPLGMRQSSARTSDVPEATFTHEIYDSGWRVYPPKSDEIMQAAGGMFVSGNDMARWLAASAGGENGIGTDVFQAAQQPLATFETDRGGMTCTGYSLGWAVCDFAGVRVLNHGGTYTGARSEMIVLPDHGVGFAAMFNSDSMTGGLGSQLAMTFVAEIAGRGDTLPSAEAFAARYGEMADRYRAHRSSNENDTGELYRANAASLASYTGWYSHPAAGDLRLAVESGNLVGWLNGMEVYFVPTAAHTFEARLRTQSDAESFTLAIGSDGQVAAIEWDGLTFVPHG